MTENNCHRESVRYEFIADSDESNSAESTVTAVHRHLRGRYHVVAIAALALAGIVATSAWHSTRPEFESSGVVRVDPVPATTFMDPDSPPVPSVMAAYVAEQAMILRGRSVLETAASDPMLRASGWPAGDAGIAALEGAMTVEQGRGQNIITVAVRDSEPNQARAAVDSVLRAYHAQAGGPAERERAMRLRSLGARRTELLNRIGELEAEMLLASDGTGPELVRRLHTQRVEEVIAIESRIEELDRRRDAIDAGIDPAGFDDEAFIAGPAALIAPPTGQTTDLYVRQLEQQEHEIIARIDSLSVRFGPKHAMIRELESELETVRIRLATTRDGLVMPGFGDLEMNGATGLAAAAGITAGGETPRDRIGRLLDRYRARGVALRQEISDLSRRRVAIENVSDRVNELQMRLSDVESRIEILDASHETDATGVTIATWGDLPVTPVRDRRAQLAMAGAIAGSILGVILVLAGAAVSPRVRYADDLKYLSGAPAVAAILPITQPGDAKAEQRATRGIHQLRSIIELDTARPDENVVAITSCARGEGRTSIALALATGLARSGRKTLIIDADLTRSRLSRELSLHDRPGLVEALGVSPQDARVHETSEPGLWALPIGLRGGLREEILSRPRLQWLMDTLRTRFDAVVIDTGPMLASAEGPTLTAVADRSVLVLERGIRVSSVRSALDRLDRVHATCLGLVLNRAEEGDFRELELGSEPSSRRAATLVETRPSTFAPAGRSAANAAIRDDANVGPAGHGSEAPAFGRAPQPMAAHGYAHAGSGFPPGHPEAMPPGGGHLGYGGPGRMADPRGHPGTGHGYDHGHGHSHGITEPGPGPGHDGRGHDDPERTAA